MNKLLERAFDTNGPWFCLSLYSLTALLIVHAAMNGWIITDHNYYNVAATAWIGSFVGFGPSCLYVLCFDPMHVWAGATVTMVVLNFNFGVKKRFYLPLSLLAALVLLRYVDLFWGFSEWYTYNRNPNSFIITGLFDELVDQLADSVGGVLACLLAHKLFE
jgi:hypothetical protein